MLSEQERIEMLEDAKSLRRRDDFRREKKQNPMTLDECISFLDDMQNIFSPFKVSLRPTATDKNLL